MRIVGTVSSGLGRAHVFMSQPHYQSQFKRILGVTAWPGTLNLTVEGESLQNQLALRNLAGLSTDEDTNIVNVEGIEAKKVEGFMRDGVSFGAATAYHANIIVDGDDIPCAVLIPDLTRHVDVVEVIAGTFLREHLDLVDGDEMELLLKR